MKFTKRQIVLVLSSTAMIIVMSQLVPIITSGSNVLSGYLSVFAIYWVGFCVPMSIFFGSGSTSVKINLTLKPLWLPFIAIGLPMIVFLGADTFGSAGTNTSILLLAILCALINGPLEELAWRRSFRANSDGNLTFEILGLVLFSLWHIPLYFSKGITFEYGAIGLVGGAVFLGAIWTFLTHKSNSVGWPMVSHALVNIAAFIPLFATNFAK